MTVTAKNTFNEFTTNGVTTEFSFDFAITDTSQVYAFTVVDGVQTEYTDFTVIKSETVEGGTITTGTALDDANLLVYRITDLSQSTDYVNGGKFPADSHEETVDKLTLQSQEQQSGLDRSLKLAIGNDSGYEVGELEEGFLIFLDDGKVKSSSVTETDVTDAKDQADAAEASAIEAAASAAAAEEYALQSVSDLKAAAISAGTTYDNIMYSANTTNAIVGFIFDADEQVTYSVPSDAQGKLIDNVTLGVLTTTDASTYTLGSINRSGVEFNVIADIDTGQSIAGKVDLIVGDSVTVLDYATGNGSGVLFFKLVAAGTGTADGGKYIDLPTLGLQLEQNIQSPVRAEAWGAKQGSANDSSGAFQAAIDYRQANQGGEVTAFGDYYLSSTISIPNGVTLNGRNKGLRLSTTQTLTDLITITGGNSGVIGCDLSGADMVSNLIGVEKPASDDNLPVTISENFAVSSTTSFTTWRTGDRLIFDDNELISVGTGLYVLDDCRNSKITGNYMLGCNGIRFEMVTQGCEGVYIGYNIILPAGGGTNCLRLECGLEVSVIGNVFDQVITGEAVALDSTSHSIDAVKLSNNWFGRQAGATGANFGIYSIGTMSGIVSDTDTYVGWQEAGFYHAASGNLTGGKITNAIFYAGDSCLRDIQLNNADVNISGCDFSGTSAIVEGSSVTGIVTGCDFDNSAVPALRSGLQYGQQKSGVTLKNRGVAVITSAFTGLFAITHGLDVTPAEADVNITLTSHGAAEYWPVIVHSTTDTVINISPRIAPGVDVAVAWSVDATR